MRSGERLPELDALKGVGILAVVLIHSTSHPVLQNQSTPELWLVTLTRFAVPGFLAVSGFLYASSEPIPLERTLARLRRVLVPYALASLLGQLYWLLRGSPRELTEIAEDLLLASTFGPYYYVFAIATLLLLTPLLARIPARWLALALAGLVVAYALRIVAATTAEVPPDPASLFWLLRDPSNGGTFFLVGWLAGLHSETVRAWCERWRGRLWLPWLLGCAGLSIAGVWPGHATLAGLCAWLNIFALVGWVFLCSSQLSETPGPIRWLSDSTYAIYLYHIFFVLSVLELAPPMHGLGPRAGLEIAAWLAGLLGACAITHAARVLLRDRARLWIGA